jgi:hypothetical protein
VHSSQKRFFAKSRGKNNAAVIESLIDEFFELNRVRVRVAHGLWVPEKEGGTVLHVPRSLKPSRFAEQAVELERNADKAKDLSSKLFKAIREGEG